MLRTGLLRTALRPPRAAQHSRYLLGARPLVLPPAAAPWPRRQAPCHSNGLTSGWQRRRLLCQTAGEPSSGAASGRDGRRRPPPPPEDSSSAYNLAAAMLAVALGALGLAYASVPLYRIFCQSTGFGGTTKRHTGGGEDDGYDLPKNPASLTGNRPVRVTFNTDVSNSLQWSFKPAQKHVTVLAGQTALAFFEATNHSSEPIIGVATYNVVPNEAGAYFNKIQVDGECADSTRLDSTRKHTHTYMLPTALPRQCFCFDEQRLLPGETVDMPVCAHAYAFAYIHMHICMHMGAHSGLPSTSVWAFYRTSACACTLYAYAYLCIPMHRSSSTSIRTF